MTAPSRRVLTDAAAAQLRARAPQVDVYVGGPPTTPRTDPDGRVHVHAILWPAPGTPTHDRLVPIVDGLVWTLQVTCVGGDPTRALACVDAVTDALDGRPIAATGIGTGYLRQVGDSGPVTEDRTATPSRWSTALIYQLHATRKRA